MNIRYTPNSKPVNYKRHWVQIYLVIYDVMWFFLSEIAIGLQSIHPNRFKMHFEPQTLLSGYSNSSTDIAYNTRIRQCCHIHDTPVLLGISLRESQRPENWTIFPIITGRILAGMTATLVWNGNLHNATAHSWMWSTQMCHFALWAISEISTPE